MDTMRYDCLYKVVMLGDSSVGKSSMLCRYVDKDFNENHISTIGVDFKITTVKIDDKIVKLQLWDTAGQERFRTIVGSYYRGAQGIILVFDVTNKESFDNLDYWIREMDSNYICDEPKMRNVYIIGNKTDLNRKRIISFERAEEFSRLNGAKYFETSAKDNIGIDDFFKDLSISALNSYNIMYTQKPILNAEGNVKINLTNGKSLSKCCK